VSSYYVIDPHTDPFSASRILDVAESSNLGPFPTTPMNSGVIVRVPDSVSVQDPLNLTDLLTKKYAGLLLYYAGFTYITYDDLLDVLNVDFAEPTLKGKFGDRNCVVLPPFVGASGPGRLQSLVTPLSGALAPSQAVVTWEVYRVTTADPSLDRAVRTYVEMPASSLTCQVSFDGGVTYYTTTDGAVLNIPALGQGLNFIMRLTNQTPTDNLFVGGWSVIY
jgi:hypothetical protein